MALFLSQVPVVVADVSKKYFVGDTGWEIFPKGGLLVVLEVLDGLHQTVAVQPKLEAKGSTFFKCLTLTYCPNCYKEIGLTYWSSDE